MTTQTKKRLSDQELIAKWKDEHIAKINDLFNTCINDDDFYDLQRLEDEAHSIAEYYCEHNYTEKELENDEAYILNKLCNILGIQSHQAIFWNRDPRGYALKIDDEFMRDNARDFYRDWGGYGIIAPTFTA